MNTSIKSVADHYIDNKCPDCGLDIPQFANAGDSCLNCGHVFWEADQRMPKINKLLAKIIIEAQGIHEDSYDKAAADEAVAQADLDRKQNPDNPYAGMGINYSKFYGKSFHQAAIEAATNNNQPELGEIVYYVATGAWNDAEWWAREQLK